ncbi:MAG TPA: SDR family oxidoreductase [Allosphingosinicella sp.]|nr:SDR family oxidoreductase [Allosphingosinicella sp.]
MTERQGIDYLDRLRLGGRGIVVLGGGEGIGRESCLALTQAGAEILCVDRSEDAARAVASEAGCAYHVADITARDQMEDVFARANALFGARLKGVVNVVGVAFVKPFEEIPEEIWDKQFDIVLRHAYFTLQIGGMALARNGGGSMTFVGSMSGVASIGGQTVYGSAKAALHHLVRGGANEFGRRQVRVNVVVPSFIRTPRMVGIIDEAQWQRMADTVPLGRVASPDEIASAILFLQSDLASFVSGTVFPVDGGVTALSIFSKF